MLQILEQTHEEKVKMYMKSTKLELIEMLIQCNLILDSRPVEYFNINEETETKPLPCICKTPEQKSVCAKFCRYKWRGVVYFALTCRVFAFGLGFEKRNLI